MIKHVYTLRVDNYMPEICNRTLPTLERYANKIGANFTVITERKYPEYPATYEKMQIYELGATNDWNIFIDADIALKSTMYDVTRVVPKDHIGIWMVYDPSITITHDEFLFEGNRRAVATSFLVTQRSNHNRVLEPLSFDYKEAMLRMKRPFVMDEYCVSRNIAKNSVPYVGIGLNGIEQHLYHCNVNSSDTTEERALYELDEFLRK